MRRCCFAVFSLLLTIGVTTAQDAVKSGPQTGAVLPAAFDALIINGKIAEGRQHCLICQNALHPAVLVFTKEPSEKTAKPLAELLAGLDKVVQTYEKDGLGSFTVFLSPDAKSSVTIGERDTTDTNELLEEATKRMDLVARLKKHAEPLKNVIVAAYPVAGPKGYDVNAKAEVTVIFFSRLKVIANWAFEEGKLTENDVGAITKKVDETMQKSRAEKKSD